MFQSLLLLWKEGEKVCLPFLLLGGGTTGLCTPLTAGCRGGVVVTLWISDPLGWGSVWAFAITIYPRLRRFLEGRVVVSQGTGVSTPT